MKQKLFLILLLLTSCTSTNNKQEAAIIHDLNVDFPTADTISMEMIQKFDITPVVYSFAVKDSTMFVLEKSKENFGHCYSLSTGKELSTLLGRGKAAYEMTSIPPSEIFFCGDSIQFANEDLRLIKTIAINDILSKPLGDRKFTTISLPDTIPAYSFSKIGNEMIIGNLFSPVGEDDCRYFIYDGGKVFYFGNFNKDMLSPKTNFKEIDYRMAEAQFASHGNKVVTTTEGKGVILQVIDVDKKIIEKERYYINKKGEPSPNYGVTEIRCDAKYIYCVISIMNKEKTKEAGERINNRYILVFDWDLNPIKKYYQSVLPMGSCRYSYSEDCKYAYYLTNPDGGEQELFRGVVF